MAATQSISILESSFQQHLDNWFSSVIDQVDEALAQAREEFMPEPQFAESRVYSPELPYCQRWFAHGVSGDVDQCDRRALIGDLETGLHVCVACWKDGAQ